MATLLQYLQNPLVYRKLPIPILTLSGIGIITYCINSNKQVLRPYFTSFIDQIMNIHQPLINTNNDLKDSNDSKDSKDSKDLKSLIITNQCQYYDEVLRYIYVMYGENIDNFNYSSEKIYHFNEWRYRRKEKPVDLKMMRPIECNIDVTYNDETMNIKIEFMKDKNGDLIKLLEIQECLSEEKILHYITLESKRKDLLTYFVDEAKKYISA